jgi:hypothetical protein
MGLKPYSAWHLHAFWNAVVVPVVEPYSTLNTGRPAALAGA